MLKLIEPGEFDVKKLSEHSGFSTRKVHYFLNHVLNEYVNDLGIKSSQGKRTFYPEEILKRLQFIKMAMEQLDKENVQFNHTRIELRDWMSSISDEEVNNVVNGLDPLVFGYRRPEKGGMTTETLSGEKLPGDSTKYGRQIPSGGSDEGEKSTHEAETWNTLHLDSNLQLRIKGGLSESKRKQLKIIGDLIKSLVEEAR